jgi:hypothetical protein
VQEHFRDVLESIQDSLSEADYHTTVSPEQIGYLISAVKQLTDLSERLYERILDLERVQNECAAESS